MSKMLKALERAKEEQQASLPQSASKRTKGGGSIVIVLSFALVGILIASSMMTGKISAELNKSKKATILVAKRLESQTKKIDDLELLLNRMNSGKMAQVKEVKRQLKDLKLSVKRSEKDISEIAIDYNILRVLVNDLSLTNQELMDNYIGMSEEVESLKRIQKREVRYRDYLISSHVTRKEE